jgi:hypothetical protein
MSDPRIAAQLEAALGDAVGVVNVGAGAGSYEPRVRQVIAVEPSPVMIAQRAPAAAPAVQSRRRALAVPRRQLRRRSGRTHGAAYWRRPTAYLDPTVRAAISGFSLLDAGVTEPAIQQLAADLESGAWLHRNAALMELDELDLGYRLVVAGAGDDAGS